MKITIKKLTKELMYKFHVYDFFSKYTYGTFDTFDLLTMYNEENIQVGYAIITHAHKFDSMNLFDHNFQSLFEYSQAEFTMLLRDYSAIINNSCYLNYITTLENHRGKGYGTFLINYIKEKYKNVWLYSVIEAEEFYRKNNFQEISEGDYNFIYSCNFDKKQTIKKTTLIF